MFTVHSVASGRHFGGSSHLIQHFQLFSVLRSMSAIEKHFTPQEIAEIWHFDQSKIRRMFENEPGVLREGQPSRRVGRVLKRAYLTMRIPESVMERVYTRLTKQ